MPRYEGRLELTWTNKDQSLLAHDDGSYEWLPQSDFRVAEVRLFDEDLEVGDVCKRRAGGNLLVQGDALHALTSLIKLPEFKREYLGKVQLAYIDPPFNTGQAFPDHYDDALEHSVWLTMMRDRLVQIHKLLADDGSVWVHLDDVEAARCRIVMDEIFGRDCFVTTFIWQKVDSPNENKATITPDHEYVICYTKTPGATTRWQRLSDPAIALAYGSVAEDGRRYRDRLLKKNGKNSLRRDRATMWFPLTAPDGTEVYPIHDDGREARWAMGLAEVTKRQEAGEIVWKQRPGVFTRVRADLLPGEEDDAKARWSMDPDGVRWVPYTREWAPASPTRPWPTIWSIPTAAAARAIALEALGSEEFEGLDPEGQVATALTDIADVNVLPTVNTTRQSKAHSRKLFPGATAFGTPKPEELLARILEISTRPGDLVLDCFVGSGTTAAVAHKMGRRWVAVERNDFNVSTYIVPRLQQVVNGTDQDGISQSIGWEGGGGFRLMRVAPSMFEEDQGIVYLADAMVSAVLAEATAAQLGFDYAPEPPFAGCKGRSRLAVVDGVVNEGVVRLLAGTLGQGERVVVCGAGIDPDARAVLRELAPGSTLRKIPAALLDRYRSSQVVHRSKKKGDQVVEVES